MKVHGDGTESICPVFTETFAVFIRATQASCSHQPSAGPYWPVSGSWEGKPGTPPEWHSQKYGVPPGFPTSSSDCKQRCEWPGWERTGWPDNPWKRPSASDEVRSSWRLAHMSAPRHGERKEGEGQTEQAGGKPRWHFYLHDIISVVYKHRTLDGWSWKHESMLSESGKWWMTSAAFPSF